MSEAPASLLARDAAPSKGLSDRRLLDCFRSRPLKIPCHVDPREASPEMIDGVMAGRFVLNGEAHDLPDPVAWRRNPSPDIEWLILLNKFYFAPGLARRFAETGDQRVAARLAALIGSWMDADIEPGFIAADVTGRRLQNWVYALAGLFAAPTKPELPAGFLAKTLRAIDSQAAWLRDNLHAARNHRTLELYALLLASLAFPEMAGAGDRLPFAVRALEENALTDFRPDGGHCEQSSHYHCIALANFLNAATLLADHGLRFSGEALERLRRAAHFAARLHRPDGEIPALSDADGGSHLDTVRKAVRFFHDPELHWWAEQGSAGAPPQNESALFPESGYAVIRGRHRDEAWADSRWLVFDAGPLGAGNHGHFDALSIEAYAYGRALIVDPGRYVYDESGDINWRAAFRETRAHSTVEINGKNQTRYENGGKRKRIAGPEPRIEGRIFGERDNVVFVGAAAVSAEYAAIHRRRILFIDDAFWIVIDDLTAAARHDYALRWQFAADVTLSLAPYTDGVLADVPGLSMLVLSAAPFSGAVESRFVSRAYGRKSPAPMLRCEAGGRDYRWTSVLLPWRDAPPEACASIDGERLVVSLNARAYEIDLAQGREGAIERRPA